MPPTTSAISASVIGIIAAPQLLAARTSRSSKGCTTPSISWPVSWPLPATTTMSPGPAQRARRVADRRARGRRPRAPRRAPAVAAPASTRGADRGRVLGAGVVVGDHQRRRRAGRRSRPSPAACPVSRSPPAPITTMQPAVGQRPQRRRAPPRRRRACGRSRRPRGSPGPASTRSSRPGHAADAAMPGGDRRGSSPASPARGDRGQRVGDVEVARQRHAAPGSARRPGRCTVNVEPAGSQVDVVGAPVGVAPRRRERRASGLSASLEQPPAEARRRR